jgi:hypothetical protein
MEKVRWRPFAPTLFPLGTGSLLAHDVCANGAPLNYGHWRKPKVAY